MRKLFILVFTVFLIASCKSTEYTVISPDKKNKVILTSDNGSINYIVLNNDSIVIEKSVLGIKLSDYEFNFTKALKVKSIVRTNIFEKYSLKTGKRKDCINHANQLKLKIENQYGKSCYFVIRAYDDGVSYRYEIDNPRTDSITDEISSFGFTKGTIAWAMNFRPDHEGFYQEQLIDTMRNNTAIGTYDYPFFGMPMLLKTPHNKWVLLHESNVLNNHITPASSLIKNEDNSFSVFFKYPQYKPVINKELQLFENILTKEDSKILVAPNYISPWRVMIIGNSLKPVVESTLIESLCPDPVKGDYSWIKPGVTTFPWWGNNYVNGDTIALKDYIDLASEMNWKFIEFDVALIGSPTYAIDEWKNTTWVKTIIDYATSKGVYVYGWDERRNLDTTEKRDDVFGRYRDLGIKGIKIDFINSVKQESMEFRKECLNDALKYNLLVSFHGDYSPRGERRTYPNLVTNEGIKGSEFYLFGNPADYPTPIHNTTVPFTRNVIGPMDYTPVAFSTPFRTTTYAHELALSVIFESGWVGMCDKPEIYRNSPAIEFLTKLVSVWNETIFLGGYPGKYFCAARRSGENWFVVGNNAGEEREVSLSLDFLKKNSYSVKLYYDGEEAHKKCSVKNIIITKEDDLKITMARNGGFAIYISEND